MSTFVPSSHSNPGTSETLANDGFYPVLELAAFKADMALGNDNEATRLVALLRQAMIEINHDLASWRAGLTYTTLADVPAQLYDGLSEKVHLYRSAVFNRARALLISTRRDYDSTKSGRDKADTVELPADDYFQYSREALSRLMNRPRSVIELI
ncbi:head completion/stabilization protein [Kiloniella laminariae]|uniref:Head completion/stabilization protein n=1 Tax=Kiloniella laminariae TaxID=454162 RepID=A0ABT4LKW0_9PROT|nr:head completion/stabilization protein [Kiloniella laminariae]MCZ4281714.1 head completion/stabilization protein [Kiloniella laminariae]